MKFSFYLLSLICLINFSCKKVITGNNLTESPDILFEQFTPKWNLYLKSSKGGWKNNDNGRFSNDDAPALLALLELYKLSNDKRYLDTFDVNAKRILESIDTKRSVNDFYRGNQLLPGWSSTRYTINNNRTIFLINDALIHIVLLKFCNALIGTDYYDKYNCSKILSNIEISFSAIFKNSWVVKENGSGYFQEVYYDLIGLGMPNNQIATIGLFCLELYLATNKVHYLDYAIASAKYLKSNFYDDGNSYIWLYKQPTNTYPDITFDDYSHSQLIFRFLIEMYEKRIFFSQEDIFKLTNTFVYRVCDANKVNYNFDGKINFTQSLSQANRYVPDPRLTYYFLLIPYSVKVKGFLSEYYKNLITYYDPQSDYNHIGEFELLHFAYAKKFLKIN